MADTAPAGAPVPPAEAAAPPESSASWAAAVAGPDTPAPEPAPSIDAGPDTLSREADASAPASADATPLPTDGSLDVLAEAVAALEADLTTQFASEPTISHADMAAAHLFVSDVEELLEAMPETDAPVHLASDDVHELSAAADLAAALDEVTLMLPAEPAATAAPPEAPTPPVTAPDPSPQPAAGPTVEAEASTYDMSDPFASSAMPAAWSPPGAPRFDSHPHESVRYEQAEPQPALPGLAADAGGIDRDPAVVLSLTRDGGRGAGSATRGARPGGIERLLRLAAGRGASALYLSSDARPSVRIDGDVRLLDGESVLSGGDVEAAVLELAPEGRPDAEGAEWLHDVAEVGRVRITTFRDHRGPGALLRMVHTRATSAEQLGLVREIQALASEPEGLILVTGPRASGKSTLVSAFVDLVNRQRNDHIITLEGQIFLVHESRGSLISQRELRGSAAEAVTATRAALREGPDVLVIDDLRSPDVLQVALDAAGSGLLVFVSVAATSSTAALERLVALCPSDQRRNVRTALAEHLRGVVAQVLLRKAGGGRLAARELVLKTSAVAALVADGQIAQLPRVIDGGRKLGMAPLNDALVAFVQSGAVDVREAYRKADDKAGLLSLLRREGIDTSFVERLA